MRRYVYSHFFTVFLGCCRESNFKDDHEGIDKTSGAWVWEYVGFILVFLNLENKTWEIADAHNRGNR